MVSSPIPQKGKQRHRKLARRNSGEFGRQQFRGRTELGNEFVDSSINIGQELSL